MCSESFSPKFAVVLAAYNGLNWIDEQLDSILNQRGVDVVVFVSVDPSVDGTAAHVATISKSDARIVILPTKGKFGGAARNFYRLLCDVDLSAVDYLAFADQDDIWHTDKLLRAYKQLHEHGYAAYSGNVTAFWPDGRQQLIDKAQSQRRYDFLFEAAGPGSTYVFDISLAQSLQKFVVAHRDEVDRVALHDLFFYAFARSKHYRWYIDPHPGLLYRQHDENQLGANAGFIAFKARIWSIASGWYRGEVVKIASLCCSTDDPFNQAFGVGGWRSRWFVMARIGQCRRRLRDRVVLFFCCMFGLF